MDCDSNFYAEESNASANDCSGCGMKQWRATKIGTTGDYDFSIRRKIKTVVSSFSNYAFA